MTRGKHRGFDEAFRREAVRLAESGTMSITEAARQLGVHVETIRTWRRAAKRDRARAHGGSGEDVDLAAVPSLEEENRRLRRENAQLLEEREILKKATAFFARDAR